MVRIETQREGVQLLGAWNHQQKPLHNDPMGPITSHHKYTQHINTIQIEK